MKQDTKRFSSLIIAALLVVAAVMIYFELIVPAYTSLETIKGQEASEQTLYKNEQQITTQVQNLLASYQSNSSSSQSVALALPVGQDTSGALAQIYGIATNANVTLQTVGVSVQAVQPGPASPSTDANGQIANAAAVGAIVKPTGTVSFQITGNGSYESFKAFLQGLETNIRLFDVSSITLQPASVVTPKGQPVNPDLFTYVITVVTYYQSS